MPLDTQGTLYTQVWTLLEGFAPFTDAFRAGNRFKTSRPRETERRDIKTDPASFPRIYLPTPARSMASGGYVPFDDSPTNVNLGIPMTLSLEWEIVHDTTTIDTQTPAEAAFDGGLMRLGRTLGLSWVTNYTNTTLSRRDEQIGGTNRTTVRGRLTVNARPMRNLLIAV